MNIRSFIQKITIACICCLLLLPGRGQSIELYHCMVDLKGPQHGIMKKYGIQEAKLIDSRYFDPQKTGKIDSAFFVRSLKEIFPSPNATGMGLLDLEDDNFAAMCMRPYAKVSFRTGLDEFIKLIRIAKWMRPQVRWSIYNIPYTSYWEKDDAWKGQGERLKELFDLVDVLTPAMYDFYPDTTKHNIDKIYIDDNMQLSLRLGEKLGKPVMPYIWQRWHEGNPREGLLLIDEDEFKGHIRQIMKNKYGKISVAGLIWFDAQSFFHYITPGLDKKDHKKVGGRIGLVKDTSLDTYARYILEAVDPSTVTGKAPKRKKR